MAKKTEEDIIGMIENDGALERQRRREVRKKRIIFAFGAALFLVMLVTVVLVFSKFFFSVRQIEAAASKSYTAQEILDASGVMEGSILFTVDTAGAARAIETQLPFILSATIVRDYPGTIRIVVKETTPEFCFSISGQYVVVSKELKVLDLLMDRESMVERYGELIEVKMPSLRNAVVGKKLEFSDSRDSEFIPTLLRAIDMAGIAEHIQLVDATVRFDIHLYYDGAFDVNIGNTKDFERKLLFAKNIIESFEEGTKGTVNVEDPDKAYVLVDKPENLLPK